MSLATSIRPQPTFVENDGKNRKNDKKSIFSTVARNGRLYQILLKTYFLGS